MELEPEPVTPTKTSGDKGKAKEDSLKTPTKGSARVLDQQATPINQRGTASQAVSDGFAALTLANVTPLLEMDVEHHEDVDFRTFAEKLLKKVLLKKTCTGDAPGDILDQCLKAVLPSCNAPETKKALKEYCEAKSEVGRYAPKIRAFNHILEALKDVDLPGYEFKPPTDVIFHRNDPMQMKAIHNDMETIRKPDIILASRQAMIESQDGQPLNPTEPPRVPFDWHIPLVTEENKRRQKKLKRRHHKYSVRLSQYIPAASDVKVTPSTKSTTDPQKIDRVIAKQREEGEDEGGREENDDEGGEENDDEGGEENGDEGAEEGEDEKCEESPLDASGPAMLGRKRPWLATDDTSSKRVKLDEAVTAALAGKTPHTPSPIVQNAFYAAEMLNRGVYALHAYSILVIDDVAWVWYFDRQNTIQTTGINFVQDLPYFAALLFAFQRFNLRDWGIEPDLKNPSDVAASFDLDFPEQHIKISINPSNPIYSNFCLNGRATRVLSATAESDDSELANRPLVAKIYWPEEDRINEASAIQQAHEALEGTGLRKHLPTVVCFMDIDYHTGDIREDLGLEPDEKTKSRVLRVLIAYRLNKLHSFTSKKRSAKKFFTGWKECFECHYALWKKGIEHGDISLGNLMLDPILGVGVLNDFDLVHITGWELRGGRRTGTVTFMALELLTDEAIDSRFLRLYRHDLESLIWVLVWVCLIIEVNGDIPTGMDQSALSKQVLRLHSWKVPSTSEPSRSSFLTHYLTNYRPSKRFEKLWDLAMEFLDWINEKSQERLLHKKRVRRRMAEGAFPEPSEDHVYKEIVTIVESYEAGDIFASLI